MLRSACHHQAPMSQCVYRGESVPRTDAHDRVSDFLLHSYSNSSCASLVSGGGGLAAIVPAVAHLRRSLCFSDRVSHTGGAQFQLTRAWEFTVVCMIDDVWLSVSAASCVSGAALFEKLAEN